MFDLTLHKRFWWSKGYLALTYGDTASGIPIIRLQSTCLFGTALHSIECDCKRQLNDAFRQIKKHGRGVVVYALEEEGKGNGLEDKIDSMLDKCGHPYLDSLYVLVDKRRYSGAARVLTELSVSKRIHVLTQNEEKCEALRKAGFVIL
ncbi:hypothetical protein HY971_03005 [Candidatus Kaiserbacteria bacterium]|nr:hypothetical protein [Candidatus Kaiserbacteria bacterium]